MNKRLLEDYVDIFILTGHLQNIFNINHLFTRFLFLGKITTHTPTLTPTHTFKEFGNSIKGTRFRIYICVLLCLWPPRKERCQASCSRGLTTSPASRLPHSAQLQTISTIQTLLKGIELWTMNIIGPSWERPRKN